MAVIEIFARLAVVAVVFGGAMWMLRRYAVRAARRPASDDGLHVVSRVSLARGSQLLVVQAGQSRFIVGVGATVAPASDPSVPGLPIDGTPVHSDEAAQERTEDAEMPLPPSGVQPLDPFASLLAFMGTFRTRIEQLTGRQRTPLVFADVIDAELGGEDWHSDAPSGKQEPAVYTGMKFPRTGSPSADGNGAFWPVGMPGPVELDAPAAPAVVEALVDPDPYRMRSASWGSSSTAQLAGPSSPAPAPAAASRRRGRSRTQAAPAVETPAVTPAAEDLVVKKGKPSSRAAAAPAASAASAVTAASAASAVSRSSSSRTSSKTTVHLTGPERPVAAAPVPLSPSAVAAARYREIFEDVPPTAELPARQAQ